MFPLSFLLSLSLIFRTIQPIDIENNGQSLLSLGLHPLIKTLHLSQFSSLPDWVIVGFANACPNVETFHIASATIATENPSDEILKTLPTICEQLRSAYLSSPLFTDSGIETFLNNCPKIEELKLPRCTGLTSRFVSGILVKRFGERSPSILRTLDISQCTGLPLLHIVKLVRILSLSWSI